MTFRMPLAIGPMRHRTVDFGDDRSVLRTARLEKLDDARKTARDVFGLRGLARNLGEHVARARPSARR